MRKYGVYGILKYADIIIRIKWCLERLSSTYSKGDKQDNTEWCDTIRRVILAFFGLLSEDSIRPLAVNAGLNQSSSVLPDNESVHARIEQSNLMFRILKQVLRSAQDRHKDPGDKLVQLITECYEHSQSLQTRLERLQAAKDKGQ